MAVNPAAKALGAYYTDEAVADFLVRWAVREPGNTVLDPSFGGGVFLDAAARRIVSLGGDPAEAIYGVEIDGAVHRRLEERWYPRGKRNLTCDDFFNMRRTDLPQVDALVGNPPFIRYQRFRGESRGAALQRASEAGVELSQLASSWAPFLVHATQFVLNDGRLAMVLPAELGHAAYAVPVIEHLRISFGEVQILSFQQKLFPHLSEDTVLLLASGKGRPNKRFTSVNLVGPAALGLLVDPTKDLPRGASVDPTAIGEGRERLLDYLLPSGIRRLYRDVRASRHVRAIGDLGDVGIGYVSGHNEFFHLSAEAAARWRIPPEFLRRAVRKGAELRGLKFTLSDWQALLGADGANWLLHVREDDESRAAIALAPYLQSGVEQGVPERYKCKSRTPWFGVPHVYVGDAFLTYMNGGEPKLVANEAEAVAPNTLHVVRLGALAARDLGGLGLATLWQTSLTALSCEIEGHSLGGGMLKLEPTEAARVVVALPPSLRRSLRALSEEIDHLLRQGRTSEARDRADAMILRQGLGVSIRDVERLRSAARVLRERRSHR